MNEILTVDDLNVVVEEQRILNAFNLRVKPGKVHAIMGPNGSGKSTLANTLMGHPHYRVTSGSINFSGNAVTRLSPDKRAKMGMFLAPQYSCAIPGVTIAAFLKEAHYAVTGQIIPAAEFQELLYKNMALLAINSSVANRCINDDFSGGEKKRLELLQLLMLNPLLAILDEIDSGLDVDALKVVAAGIDAARVVNPAMSIIVITHYQRILDYVRPDCVHIMCGGRVVASGTAELAHEVEQKGYDGFIVSK